MYSLSIPTHLITIDVVDDFLNNQQEGLLLKSGSEALKSFPNYKILDWFKLKGFADDKINVTEKLKLFWEK